MGLDLKQEEGAVLLESAYESGPRLVKPKISLINSIELSLLFIGLESFKLLSHESLFIGIRGTGKYLPIAPDVLIFFTEVLKLLVSLVAIFRLGVSPSLQHTHLYVVPGLLYFINYYLYLHVLSFSSVATLQFLIQMRIPLTAITHHFSLKRQPLIKPWIALIFLFAGVVLTQLNDKLKISNVSTVFYCFVISASSAFASIFNEKLLKFNPKPFWEQQMHVYCYGVIFSLISMLFTSSTSPLINTSLITSSVLFKIILVVLSASAGGILTGFLINKLGNLVKLCNSALANILVAVISIVFLDLTYNVYFILGALLILVSSVAYGYFMIDSSSKPKHSTSSGSFTNSTRKLLTKKNIVMIMLTCLCVFIVGAAFLSKSDVSKAPKTPPLSIGPFGYENGTAHDEACESIDSACKANVPESPKKPPPPSIGPYENGTAPNEAAESTDSVPKANVPESPKQPPPPIGPFGYENGTAHNEAAESIDSVSKANVPKSPKKPPPPIGPLGCENGPAHDEAFEVAESIERVCKDYKLADTAPNVFHGMMIGSKFKYHHYVSLKSVIKVIKPSSIYIHGGSFDLNNKLFQRAIREFDLLLVEERDVYCVWNKTVGLGEHKADVLRLETLLLHGGIYSDLDVFWLKSPSVPHDNEPALLSHEFTIGQESSFALCNGIMITKKCSPFMRDWYDRYKYFNDSEWAEHSTELPFKMWQESKYTNSKHLHVETSSLDFPSYYETEYFYNEAFNGKYDFSNKIAVHTWYRTMNGVEYDDKSIKKLNNSYGMLARHVLFDEPLGKYLD